MPKASACIALTFDRQMFALAMNAIASLQKQSAFIPWKVHVLDVGLTENQVGRLNAEGVTVVRDDADKIPVPPQAPPYFKALTCRPMLRELFPGHEIYLWMDADIVMAAPNALDSYLRWAAEDPTTIAISQEVDPAYRYVREPIRSQAYHRQTYERLLAVYGPKVAEALKGLLCFNCGIFAMHRDSALWRLYRQNVIHALGRSRDHMLEQDAMNVAIWQSRLAVRNMPSTHNWLCSASLPLFDKRSRQWVRPIFPHLPISVLHLAGSNSKAMIRGRVTKMYELYRQMGMIVSEK